TPESHEWQEHHLPLSGEIRPAEDTEQAEIPHVTTGADQSAGIRGKGQSGDDGVGQLLPAHQRQPSIPRAATLRQHSFSSLLDPEKYRPAVRVETLSEPHAVSAPA